MNSGFFYVVICGVIPSVISGIILAIVNDWRKKSDEKGKEKEEREYLTLESLNAIFSVNKELTECVLNDKPPNGELNEAYKYQTKVKHKLEEYLRHKGAS